MRREGECPKCGGEMTKIIYRSKHREFETVKWRCFKCHPIRPRSKEEQPTVRKLEEFSHVHV